MLINTQEVQGFTIQTFAEDEHLPLDATFDESVTDINKLSDDINLGKYVYFCAKVTASKNGIELGTDYLGSCCYESYEQFINPNCYHGDMIATAISEAKKNIKSLCEQ